MSDIGLLYTEENRIAVIEDRKTMTRRIPASFKEINERPDRWEFTAIDGRLCFFNQDGMDYPFKLPYAVGDLLYIKEPHYLYGQWHCTTDDIDREDAKWYFRRYFSDVWFPDNIPTNITVCTRKDEIGWFKRSPMFMFKEDARHWQRVTGVKVERLHSISELDALNEGTPERFYDLQQGDMQTSAGIVKGPFITGGAVNAYHKQWDELHGAGAWEFNPWLVAVSFERIAR